MNDAMMAETISITGHGGDQIEAYLARPLGDGPYGGVVVIHHMPGYDEGSKEITRNVRGARLPGGLPEPALPGGAGRQPGRRGGSVAGPGRGARTTGWSGTSAGAVAYLRAMPASNGKAGTIGYCSGGRQSFLAACSLPLDAAVDCYGAFVVGTPPEGMPLKVGPIVHLAKDLSCPLLGLFGADDSYPSPDRWPNWTRPSPRPGKAHEFHSYEGAGHAFFSVDRPSLPAGGRGGRLAEGVGLLRPVPGRLSGGRDVHVSHREADHRGKRQGHGGLVRPHRGDASTSTTRSTRGPSTRSTSTSSTPARGRRRGSPSS